MFVKPHDVPPLLCLNVQTEMRFGVEQFLFTTPTLWKQELFYSKSHFILHIYARFTPNSRGTWDWLTTKNDQTPANSGVGRQGRMFRLCYSPEGHKLLLNTRNDSGLLAIEIDKLYDRF